MMWIDTLNNNAVVNDHAGIRAARSGTSLPKDLTAAVIESHGFVPVSDTPKPAFSAITQACVEQPPALVNGQWVRSWVVSNLPAQQVQVNFDAAKTAKLVAADRLAKSKRDAITANVSAAEMSSWPMKLSEAKNHNGKGQGAQDSDAPNVAIEAAARGISTAALVAKVLTKANAYWALETAIAGRNGALIDAINAAATPAALEAIDINTGWPV